MMMPGKNLAWMLSITTLLMHFLNVSPSRILRFHQWTKSIALDVFTNLKNNSDLSLSPLPEHNAKIFITGALGGIGVALCSSMANTSDQILVSAHPRREKQLIDFLAEFKSQKCKFSTLLLDLCDPTNFSLAGGNFDVVIHNAGLMSTTASPTQIFSVNVHAPFALSLFHFPSMMLSSWTHPAIVIVSSSSHLRGEEKAFDCTKQNNPLKAYANSKLHVMMAMASFSRRYMEKSGIMLRFVHPGLVDTPMLQGYLGNNNFWGRSRLLRTPEMGARAIISSFVGGNENISLRNGRPSEPMGDYQKYYYVDGVSAPHRCTDLVNDIAACDVCYDHYLAQMPHATRREVASHARAVARRLRQWPTLRRGARELQRARRESLQSFADEMERGLNGP